MAKGHRSQIKRERNAQKDTLINSLDQIIHFSRFVMLKSA